MRMREVLIYVLTQIHGKQSARLVVPLPIGCYIVPPMLSPQSFGGYILPPHVSFYWIIAPRMINLFILLQENFVVHYDMLEKRPVLPQHH